MHRGFLSEGEAEAALEKALREGWITPEEEEAMRRGRPVEPEQRTRLDRVRRMIRRSFGGGSINW